VIRYRQKRAITSSEHQLIVNREKNAEMKAFYGVLWHLGGSQTDMATLKAEDIDWEQMTLTNARRKTSAPVIISLGPEASAILSALPKSGDLFPRLMNLQRKRCDSGGVVGVLSPHKNDSILTLIEQSGARVRFLPAYSPDLNPIEKMWSKVKQFLRSAEARTGEALVAAVAAALASITPQNAINWFASCGYSFI